jgi:hypothetical protein
MTDRPQLLMLLGAPRSGTTWLQGLLGAHDAIATPQETDIFRLYLAPLAAAWNGQLGALAGRDGGSRRRKGLPLVLTQQEFEEAARALLESMIDAVVRMKPSARVVVEKSPAHSLHVGTILRFEPAARFLHVVRDGRDAASSMLAAAGTWGSGWAPSSVAQAARIWRDHVHGAREAESAPNGYLEVRYEDLRGHEGPELLARVFAVAGVDVSVAAAADLLERHSFERQQATGAVAPSILIGGEARAIDDARLEPEGFFRAGTIGAWREEWSVRDKRAFAAVAGDLLVALGYEPDDRWIGAPRRPAPTTRVAHRLANSAARGMRRAAAWVEGLPLRR